MDNTDTEKIEESLPVEADNEYIPEGEDDAYEKTYPEQNEDSDTAYDDEMTNLDYINMIYDNHEKMYADLETDERNESWYRLRSQVNSGLALGLSKQQIDVFAKRKYDYEQREVLKYIIYAGCSKDIIVKIANPKYTASEMIVMYESGQREKSLFEAVKEPIDTISESVAGFKFEFDVYRERINLQLKEKDEKIHEIEQENERLMKEIERMEEIKQKQQKTKSYDEDVARAAEAIANKKYQEMVIEQMAKQRERQEIENEVRKQYERENNGKGRRLFGKNKKNKSAYAAGYIQQSVSGDNITDMLLHSSLSSAQLQVITLAVKCNIENETLENMIRQNMPAENMKQMVEVILVRRENERRMKMRQASELSKMKESAYRQDTKYEPPEDVNIAEYGEELYYGE